MKGEREGREGNLDVRHTSCEEHVDNATYS
jgi:hypothetical protein